MIEVEKSELGCMEERVQVRTGGHAVHSCVCVCVFAAVGNSLGQSGSSEGPGNKYIHLC